MKKIIIITVSVILSLSVIAGIFIGVSRKAHDREMYERIYSQLSDTLTNFETMYSSVQKSYAYASEFSNNPSWENLERARIANSAAINIVSALEPCMLDISREEMEFCAKNNVAIDSLYVFNIDDFSATQSDFIKTMQNMNMSLFSLVFYDENYKYFNEKLSFDTDALYIYRDITHRYANAVMCNFPPKLEKKYLAELKETHPLIFSTEKAWGNTMAEISILLREEIAALDENLLSMTYMVGTAEGDLEKAKLDGFVYNDIDIPYEKVRLPNWIDFSCDSIVYSVSSNADITDIDTLVESANLLTIRSKDYSYEIPGWPGTQERLISYDGHIISETPYSRPYISKNEGDSFSRISEVSVRRENNEIIFKMDVGRLCLTPNK